MVRLIRHNPYIRAAQKLVWLINLLSLHYIRNPMVSIYRRYFTTRVAKGYDQELKRFIEIPLLYHNSHYLIVNKPYDVNIHARISANEEKIRPSVESILKDTFPSYELKNLHQIDYATSGIYCFGLHTKAAADGSAMFRRRLAKKEYHAIVKGHVEWSEKYINLPIGDLEGNPLKRVINGVNAAPAETYCHVLKRGYYGDTECTFVSLRPITGRRHQLRVHMKEIGHPIIGDLSYEKPLTPSFRMMLHAYRIELPINTINPSLKSRKANRKASNLLSIKIYSFINNLYDYYKGIGCVGAPISLTCESGFEDLVNVRPYKIDDFNAEYLKIRMSRYEWVVENIERKHLYLA